MTGKTSGKPQQGLELHPTMENALPTTTRQLRLALKRTEAPYKAPVHGLILFYYVFFPLLKTIYRYSDAESNLLVHLMTFRVHQHITGGFTHGMCSGKCIHTLRMVWILKVQPHMQIYQKGKVLLYTSNGDCGTWSKPKVSLKT